jgi:hypothetical protein
MNKVYAVYHCWSETYYNTIRWESELICCFDNLKEAEEFKKKYSLPYDNTPWALQEGQLVIKELPTTYDETKFKWLKPKTTLPEDLKIDEDLVAKEYYPIYLGK